MTISPDRRVVVVMVKEPRPGRVKTRLARDIGTVEAAWWFRRATRRLLRRIADPRWRVVLAVSPDREGIASRVWPEGLQRLPQGSGDLGVRMVRIFASLPPTDILIVGGDIPGLSPRHLARAFARLGSHDAVFGPARDGGYWLVGLRAGYVPPRGFMSGVRWSTGHALADTLATLPGARIALADTLSDVDTGADLRALGDSA